MCGCACGSCLDPLVLPVGPTGATGIQGLTGATGATGAAGADGSSTIVLHNDTDRSTTTSALTALFSPTKAYSIPSGTLSNNDVVELTIIFNTTSFGQFEAFSIDVFFGGSSFTSVVAPLSFYNGVTDQQPYAKATLEISRVDATTLFINADTHYGDENGYNYYNYHFTNRALTVADLDSNALAIDVRGGTSSGNLHCDQLLVKHFKV